MAEMAENTKKQNGNRKRIILKQEEILKIKTFKDVKLNNPADYYEGLEDAALLKKQSVTFICNTEYKEIKVVKIMGVFTFLLQAKVKGSGKEYCDLYVTSNSAKELAKMLDKCLAYHGHKPKYFLKKCGERVISIK